MEGEEGLGAKPLELVRGRALAVATQAELLAEGEETLLLGDLILMEVLRGCRSDREYERVLKVMSALACVTLGGRSIAV